MGKIKIWGQVQSPYHGMTQMLYLLCRSRCISSRDECVSPVVSCGIIITTILWDYNHYYFRA